MWISFLITTAPVYYLVINSFFQQPAQGWESLFRPYFLGFVWGISSLIITSGNLFGVSFSSSPINLLLWYWTRGPGWPVFLISLVSSLRYWSSMSTWTRARQIIAWFCGAGTVYMLWDAFTYNKILGEYWLFFHPFVWIACSSCCAFLLDISMQRDGLEKILFILLAFFATFFFSLTIILYLHVSVYLALGFCVALALFGTFLIYLQARGRVNF